MAFLIKSLRFIFLPGLVVLSQNVFANALQCRDLFGQNPSGIPGIHESLVNAESPEAIAQVAQLTRVLIKENAGFLVDGNRKRIPYVTHETEVTPEFINVRFNNTIFAEYEFQIKTMSPTGERLDQLTVRSNGKVAFLNRTWEYRKNSSSEVKRYKAAYFDGEGIKTIDQAEAIIHGFPELMVLSRNMGKKERLRWVNGEPYFPSVMFGNRVHFMPHASKFDANWEPYYIQISKKELLDFYHRGELEINIYEPTEHMDLSKVDVKINFEMVFIGDQGVSNLAPFMKAQLQNQHK